jgi:hypothetical protein
MIINDEIVKMWKWPWSILMCYLSFAIRGRGKPQKTSVMTAILWVKVLKQNLLNKKQDC